MTKTLICPATGTKVEARDEDVARLVAAGYTEPATKKTTRRTTKKAAEAE